MKTAARMTRAAAVKRSGLQVEDDENVPDKLADETVVAIVKVPLTAAVAPAAVFVNMKEALEPPATTSSSASVSSMMISILFLLVNPWLMTCEDNYKAKVLHITNPQCMLTNRRDATANFNVNSFCRICGRSLREPLPASLGERRGGN
jgi:hypothetical protein